MSEFDTRATERDHKSLMSADIPPLMRSYDKARSCFFLNAGNITWRELSFAVKVGLAFQSITNGFYFNGDLIWRLIKGTVDVEY